MALFIRFALSTILVCSVFPAKSSPPFSDSSLQRYRIRPSYISCTAKPSARIWVKSNSAVILVACIYYMPPQSRPPGLELSIGVTLLVALISHATAKPSA